MPSGSHGGGHHSGGSHSTHSSSSSRGGSHTYGPRVYRPYVFYRHGMPYYIGGGRIAAVITLIPVLLFLLLFSFLMTFVFLPSTKDDIKDFEDDYKYYQNMIAEAKEDPSRMTYGVIIDYFDGYEKYDDEDLEDAYGYTYYILEKVTPGYGTYLIGGEYYDFVYEDGVIGKLSGWTYLVYTEDEVKAIVSDYKYNRYNTNNQAFIKLALDETSTNDNITSSTDSVPIDYAEKTLDDDFEYQELLKDKKVMTIISIIMFTVSGILFIILIKNLIPKKGKPDEKEMKDYNDYKTMRDKQRNQIFEENNKESVGTRYCEYCGKEIRNDAKFCPFCGSRFL